MTADQPGGRPYILIAGREYDVPGAVRTVTHKDPGGFSFYRESTGEGDIGGQLIHPRTHKGKKVNTIEELRELVHCIVLHTDLCPNSESCFRVLVGRGLSTHFMIDWDGTIYQSVDVLDQAIHGGEVNKVSIGIDLNNQMPNLAKEPKASRDYGSYLSASYKHQVVDPDFKRPMSEPMIIQNGRVQSFGYTDAQYRSLTALVKVLSTELPLIERQHPMDATGQVIPKVMEDGLGFKGVIAHWHLSVTRWDPGPGFDWQRLYHALRGEDNFYPVQLGKGETDRELFTEGAMGEVNDLYYQNTEGGSGGYYPMGVNQQWHGGVHLHIRQGTPVRAMLSGTVVAARSGPPTELGSNNFVVMRHELPMPKETDPDDKPTKLVVYSLYMHLDPVDLAGRDEARTPKWLTDAIRAGKDEADEQSESLEKKKPAEGAEGSEEEGAEDVREEDEDASGLGTTVDQQTPYLGVGVGLGALRKGEVAIFGFDSKSALGVASGEIVGWVGEFGEDIGREPLLHVELFADRSWKQAIDLGLHAQHWSELAEDTTGSLHVRTEDLLSIYGVPRRVRLGGDGFLIPRARITPGEVERFYQGSGNEVEKAYLRKCITRHVSEWSDQVDWVRSLSEAQEWNEKIRDFESVLKDKSQRYRDGVFSRELRRILPFVWLTKEVAKGIGLDVSEWNGVLYYFQPIYFLKWLKFNSSNRLRVISRGKSRKQLLKDFEQAKKKLAEDKLKEGEPRGPDGEELLDGTFVGDILGEDINPREVLDPLRSLPGQGQWPPALDDDY